MTDPKQTRSGDLRNRYAPEAHRIDREKQSWQRAKAGMLAVIGCALVVAALSMSVGKRQTFAIFPLCALFGLGVEMVVHGGTSLASGETWEELSRAKKLLIALLPAAAALAYLAIMA
jgi:hypothetical protein